MLQERFVLPSRLTPSQRRIPAEALTSDSFAAFTRRLLAKDGFLDLYIHQSDEPLQLSSVDKAEEITAYYPVGRKIGQLIDDHISALNGLLKNLKIRLVSSVESADVKVIAVNKIPDVIDSNTTLGLSVPVRDFGGEFWEVFINKPLLGQGSDGQGFAVLHELGHVFGLEHAFDGSDGDRAGSKSPWKSYFPDETIMAYRSARTKEGWSSTFSRNDLVAFTRLWGPAAGAQLPLDSRAGSELRGRKSDDVLMGGPASDRLRGLGGNDLLIDGFGADRLDGGQGFNRYRCTSDGQPDQVLIQLDGQVDVVTSLGREDRLLLRGVRPDQLRFEVYALEVQTMGTLAGIGIWARDRLEVLVADPDRQLEQVRAQTRALGS